MALEGMLGVTHICYYICISKIQLESHLLQNHAKLKLQPPAEKLIYFHYSPPPPHSPQ